MVAKAESLPGFRCPRCGVKLHTARTIPLAGGGVKRVRRCPRCPYKLVTTERPAGGRR